MCETSASEPSLTVASATLTICCKYDWRTSMTLKPEVAPRSDEKHSLREKFTELRKVAPALLLAFLVFGGLFAGLFTPTEAGAVGAALCVLIAAGQRKLTWRNFITSVAESFTTTSALLFIVIGANLLARFVALSGVDSYISDVIASMSSSTYLFLAGVVIIYLILGMFLEPTGAMIITLPIVLPVAATLGVNELWFGIFLAKLLEVGMITPPIGLNVFVLNGVVRLIIGPGDQNFADGARFVFTARDFKEWSGLAEGLALKSTQLITVITAAIVVALLFWFLNRTRTGKSMRAYSDNEDLALLSGINPERVVMITWLLVATLATIAGTLYGLDKTFKPFTYFQLLLPVFASAIVGGLGSPVGAIAGGFVIAFSEVGITYAWKKVAEYLLPEAWEPNSLLQLLGTDYKFAVSFVILVIVLLIRPTGLFKGKSV